MKAVPHFLASILAIASLAGCASVQEPQPPAAVAAAAEPGAEAGTDAAATITGSRIPSRRTEKMVSRVGSQDYKQNKESLPAPLQSH